MVINIHIEKHIFRLKNTTVKYRQIYFELQTEL